VHVCPAKSKTETRIKALNMLPQPPLRQPERENYSFFLDIPEYDRRDVKVAPSRALRYCSRCSNIPALAPVVEKRRISNC
jgi:pyruvate-ferredoxin/flavodoxin oxidoreductase